MRKIPRQKYTAEFKELALRRVKDGQSAGAVAKDLGLIEQTLENWVKAFDAGKLNGAGGKKVTPEETELSRLRAENIRLKRELELTKEATFDRSEMCAALDVSISGYRAWKRGGTPNRKRLTDSQMLTLIKAIHVELKSTYGSPRMVRELRFSASKERV